MLHALEKYKDFRVVSDTLRVFHKNLVFCITDFSWNTRKHLMALNSCFMSFSSSFLSLLSANYQDICI